MATNNLQTNAWQIAYAPTNTLQTNCWSFGALTTPYYYLYQPCGVTNSTRYRVSFSYTTNASIVAGTTLYFGFAAATDLATNKNINELNKSFDSFVLTPNENTSKTFYITAATGQDSFFFTSSIDTTASVSISYVSVREALEGGDITFAHGGGSNAGVFRYLTNKTGTTGAILNFDNNSSIKIYTFKDITGTVAMTTDNLSQFTNDAGFITLPIAQTAIDASLATSGFITLPTAQLAVEAGLKSVICNNGEVLIDNDELVYNI